MVKLETNRLILRPFMMSDLEDFYEYASVPGVGEACGWRHHESLEESEAVLKVFSQSGSVYAVVLKHEDKVIGSISIDGDTRGMSMGVVLGYCLSKSYWHQGYMSEALRTIVRYVFFQKGLDYIKAGHFIDNERSKRVLIGLGLHFLEEGKYKTQYGEVKDVYDYILYKDEYLNSLEKVKLYNLSLEPANKFVYRGDAVPKGYYRGVVDIIIYNTKYNKFLVTRRDRNKESAPGLLETTGGAITYNEGELESAVRELYEETGIADAKIRFLYKINMNSSLFFVYFAKTECELDSIVLQPGETTEYYWLAKDEYLRLWESDLVNKRQGVRIKRALEELE